MRDFRITCHFAMYSGVSDGASGSAPREPSESGADGWVAAADLSVYLCRRRFCIGWRPARPNALAPNGLMRIIDAGKIRRRATARRARAPWMQPGTGSKRST